MSLRGEDYKEHTRIIDQELAAWVGLNESIFLEQLHYILTNNNSVGKFADGKKWYRDKPHDFVVKYFMFWDESIVKRTIANLREDGLILARSDLNKNPKDRSLWYTISYEAIQRLSGPVERMAQKLEVRKRARRIRTEKDRLGKQPDYTKVQDALLTDVPREMAKAQDDRSTTCNEEIQQNVLLTQSKTLVQNVPTPKDSLPKDSQSKEKIPSKGDGKPSSPLPKRVRKPRSFREDSPKAILSRQMFSALADLIKYDLDMLGAKQRGQLNQAEKRMREKGWIPADIDAFKGWWYANDWRGKKNQPPGLEDIRQTWKQFLDWRKEQVQWDSPLASTGHYADPIPPPTLSPEEATWQKALSDVKQQIPPWLAADIRAVFKRSNGTFKLAVSSEGNKEWVDNRLMKIIQPALSRIDSSIQKVEVVIQ